MYINIVATWIQLEYIQYLLVATAILGLMKCLKSMVVK